MFKLPEVEKLTDQVAGLREDLGVYVPQVLDEAARWRATAEAAIAAANRLEHRAGEVLETWSSSAGPTAVRLVEELADLKQILLSIGRTAGWTGAAQAAIQAVAERFARRGKTP